MDQCVYMCNIRHKTHAHFRDGLRLMFCLITGKYQSNLRGPNMLKQGDKLTTHDFLGMVNLHTTYKKM